MKVYELRKESRKTVYYPDFVLWRFGLFGVRLSAKQKRFGKNLAGQSECYFDCDLKNLNIPSRDKNLAFRFPDKNDLIGLLKETDH